MQADVQAVVLFYLERSKLSVAEPSVLVANTR